MGTLKVNGAISATGTISASSFLGNASTATKLATARAITVGNTAKNFDGSSNISWSLIDIGAAYYHTNSWDFTVSHNKGYTTFDQSAPNGGPSGEAWVNGFVSTHNNYLSSYIVNGHRNDNWYLGYGEHSSDGYTKNPVWRKIIHSGNWSEYCAPTSHNHTSLNNITSLSFLTHSDDGAQIISRVSDTITYFDFELWDDGSSDMFRWRFERWDNTTSSGVPINLMTLTTTSTTSNTANLVVNGNITASNFYGTLDWSNISNKPTTFTPSSHTHNLLTAGGEGSIANTRNNHYTCAVLSGGWASSDAGYSTTYGTTLDISGYSTWYHRLAFGTNGTIEYWHGINTNTMSKVGNLCFSNHTHNYLPLSGGTMSGNIIIGSNYITGETGSTGAKCHGLQLGYPNHDYWTFSEWGGLYHFYKYQASGSTVTVNTLCGSINEYGWVQGSGGYGTSFPSAPALGQIYYYTG